MTISLLQSPRAVSRHVPTSAPGLGAVASSSSFPPDSLWGRTPRLRARANETPAMWAAAPCTRGAGGAPHAGRTPVQAPQGWVLQSLALLVNANGVLEAGMLGAAALFSSSGQKSHHILPGKNCP